MEVFEVPFFSNSLRVTQSHKGITEVLWQKKSISKFEAGTSGQEDFHNKLEDFLSGKPTQWPLDWQNIEATDFQKKVWQRMQKIPWGQTRTYGEIARDLDKPGAARAVGTACGKNPVLLAIPCHRVVGSQGLGGFSGGGLPVKRKLLSLEGQL